MQEERRLVHQPLRRLDALDDDAARHRVQLRVLLGRQLATRKDNHRDVGERCVVADRFEQVETRHVGQPEIEHDAIRRLLADRRERFLAGTDGHQVDVVMPQKLGDAALLGGAVFDNQEAVAAWGYVVLDPGQRGLEVLRRAWLVDKGEAPRASPCWRSSSSVTTCTGMCRVAGSCFSWLSTVQPSMSGRKTSSETAVG